MTLRPPLFAFALLLLCIGGVIAEEAVTETQEDKPVLDLNDGNFWATILDRKSETFFVEFYAPWCGHCQRLAPTWESLGQDMKQRRSVNEPSVIIARVDATANNGVASKFKVKGYPTIKLIKDSKVYLYEGSRSLEDLTKFALESYSVTAASDFPVVPGWNAIVKESTSQVSIMWEQRKWAVIVVIVFVFPVGFLLGLFICPSAYRRKRE